MLEIYCEKVRDLLSSKPPPKGGLKVRENPKTGFYGKSGDEGDSTHIENFSRGSDEHAGFVV